MSPSIPFCSLCGGAIVAPADAETWVNTFRALISRENEVSLTGVGIDKDPLSTFKYAPLDPEARNTGLEHGLLDSLDQAHLVPSSNVFIHESCLALLERYTPGITLDKDGLRRLYETCVSLPISWKVGSLSWGHDYGGLISIDHDGTYPWEGFQRYEEPHQDYYTDSVLRADPLSDLEAKSMFEPSSTRLSDLASSSVCQSPNSGDVFSKLPPEIRFQIAIHLPTSDFYSARSASKAFYSIYHSQSFWKTRFFGSGERSWLFEAAIWCRGAVDWRHIYRQSNDHRLGNALQNRKRIWSLFPLVSECINLRLTRAPDEASSCTPGTMLSATAMLDNRELDDIRMWEGCRSPYHHRISIPKSLNTLQIHFFQLGDAKYITGITLKGEDEPPVQAGYVSPMRQSIALSDPILGIVVAIHARGIQALKVLTPRLPTPASAAWIGDPTDCPKTERLALAADPITHFDISFDGCKIVSLNLPRELKAPEEQTDNDLRSLALWYPDVPPPSATLRDLAMPSRSFFVSGDHYLPLIWAYFGGKGGSSLCHLTSVTAFLRGDIVQMVFAFNSGPDMILGRYKHGPSSATDFQSVNFPIDGPGGEFIDAVDIYYYAFESELGNGLLEPGDVGVSACKLYTNRGRSCLFKNDSKDIGKKQVHRFSNPSETTRITGFYTQKQPDACMSFSGFGVVLETVAS